MIQIYKKPLYEVSTDSGIAVNSLDLTTNLGGMYFVSKASDIVSKATSSAKIEGVSLTQGTFASDNQTVAKKRVEYIESKNPVQYGVTITGGTITVADEGKFFNLSDEVTVDGTTESSASTVGAYVDTTAGTAVDPVLIFQLKLVKFISATYSVFEIVA
jgi:hypothetical protein